MTPRDAILARQLWAIPTATTDLEHGQCTSITLPSDGVLSINPTSVITLTQYAMFRPQCTDNASIKFDLLGSNSSVVDLRDPFYASVFPQSYAVGAATVISYMLVIILCITPRTFFVGGAGGGARFIGRRGIIRGASGSASIIGVGGRPWLQKVATFTVAISLTIATSKTFAAAQRQYDQGYEDATALTDEVVGSLEIRVIRVISDTFLWLAQVQTLIRLFPRHKEKVIIKWIGFALIIFDTIFSILNSFVDNSSKTRPRDFTDAIPALCYLFELALSLLYAAWVVYYSLEKRRFAYFHSKMRNICLLALLALTAVLIPVIFFVLDIAKPDVAGWGDYMRWVGAAAASVVVWEWVERIEALERDERKDGILGREIFDGDEMLDITPSLEGNGPRERRQQGRITGKIGGGGGGVVDRAKANSTGRSSARKGKSRMIRSRVLPSYIQDLRNQRNTLASNNHITITTGTTASQQTQLGNNPVPPPPIASPVSRADTASAASTLYAIHYHSASTSTTPGPDLSAVTTTGDNECLRESQPLPTVNTQTPLPSGRSPTPNIPGSSHRDRPTNHVLTEPENRWRFKRHRKSPPREVTHAVQRLPTENAVPLSDSLEPRQSRIHASQIIDHSHMKKRRKVPEILLPRIVVPAPLRNTRNVWSPVIPDRDIVDSSRANVP